MGAIVFAVFLSTASILHAGEIDDARAALESVQARLAAHRERVGRIKAEMREIEVLARHEIPAILQREKELLEKIDKLEKSEKEKK